MRDVEEEANDAHDDQTATSQKSAASKSYPRAVGLTVDTHRADATASADTHYAVGQTDAAGAGGALVKPIAHKTEPIAHKTEPKARDSAGQQKRARRSSAEQEKGWGQHQP